MPSTDLWIVYALAFGAVLLGVQGLYWFFSRTHEEKKAINRRLALGQRLGSPVDVLDTLHRERGLGLARGIGALEGFEELVLQTGLRVEPRYLLIIVLGIAAVLFFVFGLALGFGFLAAGLAITCSLASVYLAFQLVRRKRISRFDEQLPDALDVIVRGLRAGHPFRVALGLVVREMPDPIGSEFGILADEVSFGLDLSTAMDNVVRRVGHEDLAFFAVAVSIQSQTGGNLAEILSRLANLVRSRTKLRLKVHAITSEGRLSAVFLSLAPFVLFGIISVISPGYFGEVRSHPIIPLALVLGFLLLAIGNIIMYRMVRFKV
jgi:tight adherence protein B